MVEQQTKSGMSAETAEHFRALHRQFLLERGLTDGDVESERRTRDLLRFLEQGLPTAKDEDWRSTNLQPIRATPFGLPPALETDGLTSVVERVAVPRSHRFVFVNGRLADALSSGGDAPPGLSTRTLGRDEPEHSENAFTALNSAFLGEGLDITVARGVELSRPIELIFLSTGRGTPFMAHTKLRLTLEPGARATLVEQFLALDGTHQFNNFVSDIDVRAGADLQHARLLDEGKLGLHVALNRVRVDRDAHYASSIVQFGGRILRNELRVSLRGTGAHADLFGLYRLDGKTQADNHTVIDHADSSTTSRELYKGVLDGASRGAFLGRIVVREQTRKINAQQTNNNLLLSPDARVDSTPQLEIYADDVQCRHGSTIGRLDEKMLFYLRSRGISKARARDLLTYAFANEIIDTLPIPELRERLTDRLIRATDHGAGTEPPPQETLP